MNLRITTERSSPPRVKQAACRFSVRRSRYFLNGLPECIVRAKGILNLSDEPDRQVISQLVRRRWSLKPGSGWNQNIPENHRVVIGGQGQFDPEALDTLWQSWIDYFEEEV